MPAQLSVCNGCCCGRVEKGHNEVPIDTLKEAWEKHELAEHVKLTISTCLGPCRMHNVSLLKTANERTWIGKLSTQDQGLNQLSNGFLPIQFREVQFELPYVFIQLKIRRFAFEDLFVQFDDELGEALGIDQLIEAVVDHQHTRADANNRGGKLAAPVGLLG